ncbi:MAG: type IV pilus modification PilV family protein [Solirubrobacteraceae bacterium]
MQRLRQQQGFTLVEVIVATVILTVGVLGLIATFDGARKLTLLAERRAAAAHRAQWEIEKLQAQAYAELAMTSTPAHSSEATNPDHYVDYNSPLVCTEVEKGGCYAANSEKLTEEEPLVVYAQECDSTHKEKCGIVTGSPVGKSCSTNAIGSCEWKDGKTSGYVYDFITWHNDEVCKNEVTVEAKTEKLCTTQSDKRLTVISTVIMPAGSTTHPQIRASTIISDTTATPKGRVVNGAQNPLTEATTKCGTESCITGIQSGNPQSWYLADSPATGESPVAPTVSHKLHNTVAATGKCTKTETSGCAVPDLMAEAHPTATTLYDYSTDLDGEGFTLGSTERGGRLLRKEAECSGTPGNAGGETWATPKLSAATQLTGYGGLTIYTQTLGNTSATVKLCLGVYDFPETITESAKAIGTVFEYTPVTWPTTTEGSLTGLSFVFSFLSKAQLEAKETVTVEAKHHIGLRIWPANSSTNSISVAYATTGISEEVAGKLVEKAGYPSRLQLNTE